MITKVRMPEDEFMTIVSNAIMTTSLSGRDTQIIHDGIYFNVEEVFCREFIRGYVIPYSEKSMKMPDPDSQEFSKWFGDLLYVHVNACCDYFESKDYRFDFSQGNIAAGNKTEDFDGITA